MPLAKVIAERPDVFNHNVEVVPRLYPIARRGSKWERSLRVLRNAKEMGGDEVMTKSGFMVGLGETIDEMVDAFGTLREHDVQVLTVGQYLRPSERHLPVVRYWHPDEFKALEDAAYAWASSTSPPGPLVRSSYHADEHVPQDRPGIGPLAAVRLTPLGVPAQGQPPDRPVPGRHGRADRRQRRRVLLPAGRRAGSSRSNTDRRLAGERLRGGPVRAGERVRVGAGASGDWLSVLTAMFMHGGILHLGGNMLFLWIFGNNVEDAMGPREVPRLLPRSAGVAAMALQTVSTRRRRSPRSGPRARSRRCSAATSCSSRAPGSSRAIFVILFFTMVELPAAAVIGLWFAQQVIFGALDFNTAGEGGGVAYFAHIGGFLFGLLAVKLLAAQRPQDPGARTACERTPSSSPCWRSSRCSAASRCRSRSRRGPTS